MIRALLVIGLASAIAHAEPERVLVVDPDAELVHALEWTLQPWRMVVVAESGTSVDPALVGARAAQANAQFIVWREGEELVVFDRKRDVVERRPARKGAMDPVSAASAALTVKTMMRLPDPARAEEAAPAPGASVTRPATPIEDTAEQLRVEAGVGVDTEVALRARIGARFAPTRWPLHAGAALELADHDVDQASFQGSARDYSFLAIASYSLAFAPFELEPFVGAGAIFDVLDGEEAQVMRRETTIVPAVRVGAALWWWQPSWGLALVVGMDAALGTPTYTKTGMGQAIVYEMPGLTGTIALVAAWRH